MVKYRQLSKGRVFTPNLLGRRVASKVLRNRQKNVQTATAGTKIVRSKNMAIPPKKVIRINLQKEQVTNATALRMVGSRPHPPLERPELIKTSHKNFRLLSNSFTNTLRELENAA